MSIKFGLLVHFGDIPKVKKEELTQFFANYSGSGDLKKSWHCVRKEVPLYELQIFSEGALSKMQFSKALSFLAQLVEIL